MAIEDAVKEIDQEIVKLQSARIMLAGAPLAIADFGAAKSASWTLFKGSDHQPAPNGQSPATRELTPREKDTERQRKRRAEQREEAAAEAKAKVEAKAAKKAAKAQPVKVAVNGKHKGPNPNHPLTGRPKPRAQVEKTLETKARKKAEAEAAAKALAPAIEPAAIPAPVSVPAKKAAKKATKTKG